MPTNEQRKQLAIKMGQLINSIDKAKDIATLNKLMKEYDEFIVKNFVKQGIEPPRKQMATFEQNHKLKMAEIKKWMNEEKRTQFAVPKGKEGTKAVKEFAEEVSKNRSLYQVSLEEEV